MRIRGIIGSWLLLSLIYSFIAAAVLIVFASVIFAIPAFTANIRKSLVIG